MSLLLAGRLAAGEVALEGPRLLVGLPHVTLDVVGAAALGLPAAHRTSEAGAVGG